MITFLHICNLCDKKFSNKNILNRHLREKHLQGPIYKCNLCKTCFSRKERLMRHLQSVHFNLKYQCPKEECKKSFVEKFKFRMHMSNAHNYSICKKCKKIFSPRKKGSKKSKKVPKHDCMVVREIYQCLEPECQQDYQTYSRLNFFLRHLQISHKIKDFETIKQKVAEGRIEKEKWFIPKPKHRSKQPEEVKIQDFLEDKNSTKNSVDDVISVPTRGEGLISKLGQEVVNNINILCIMENNKKKSRKRNSIENINYKSEEIILGKR